MVVQDVMHKLSVPLEELYVGSTKKLALNRHIADGQGRVTKKKEVLEVCYPADSASPRSLRRMLKKPRCVAAAASEAGLQGLRSSRACSRPSRPWRLLEA